VIEIKKSIRALVRNRNAGDTAWEFPPLGDPYVDEWTRYGGVGGNLFVAEDTIDIAGLTNVQEKALQIANVNVYQSDAYSAGTELGPNGISPLGTAYEWLFITETPFDVVNWHSGLDTSLFEFRLPCVYGDMQTATVEALSSDQVLFGRWREISNNVETASNVAQILNESFFGDAKQTMSSKLYVYRIFYFKGATGPFDLLRAPELEIVINSTTTELSDLEQIMELRRSYLTQQTIA
tara:strand:+ start:80 stop:790 length:711 start_codon:yes stop_codon:yes gene_type:complete